MMIIGCDFHTRYQQIAMMDDATGELVERRLDHESGEAEAFYRHLQSPVRVGMEATGPIHWFVRLAGVASKVPDIGISGISSGKGNMKAVAKAIETKIANGTASKMSLRTAVRGAIGGQVAAAGRTATEAAGDSVKKEICHSCD